MRTRLIRILLLCLVLSLRCPIALGETLPPVAQISDEVEESVEEKVEEPVEDDFGDEEEGIDPDSIQEEANPLNPVQSLDDIIKIRMNDDVWSAMMGDLPCLEATEPCINQLQSLAIDNSLALKAIDERVELVNEKIEEARRNNQRTINLGIFEPAVTAFFQIETIQEARNAQGEIIQERSRRGFLDRILMFFDNPVRGLNDLLALVGVPLFRNASGGDQAAQQRNIAIADLQVKVAEIQNKRGDLAQKLREQVILEVLDFDQLRREFQISQEVTRREVLRLQVVELDYRFAGGTMDTPQYLRELSSIDQQKAATFREWARLRSQLIKVKVLVLGVEE
jgi:hypothetical protein